MHLSSKGRMDQGLPPLRNGSIQSDSTFLHRYGSAFQSLLDFYQLK